MFVLAVDNDADAESIAVFALYSEVLYVACNLLLPSWVYDASASSHMLSSMFAFRLTGYCQRERGENVLAGARERKLRKVQCDSEVCRCATFSKCCISTCFFAAVRTSCVYRD